MKNKGKESRQRNAGYVAKKTDIVVLVIGPVGAGKSTFLNNAALHTHSQPLEVSHGMNPCTTEPFPVVFDSVQHMGKLDGHRLILVDTPGFGNSCADEKKILGKIDKWLEESCPNVIIGGVLYIYDITNKKIAQAEHTVFGMIRKRYGNSALQKTIVATTNWGPPEPTDAVAREKELKEEHWRAVTIDGAKVYRFLNTSESAWSIINNLLERIDLAKNKSGSHLMKRVRNLLARLRGRE